MVYAGTERAGKDTGKAKMMYNDAYSIGFIVIV